jgi:TPR repeat protein
MNEHTSELEGGVAAHENGDHSLASRQPQPLADGGDPTAKRYVAYMGLQGRSGSRLPEKAVELLRLAVKSGFPNAHANLGGMYQFGQGARARA